MKNTILIADDEAQIAELIELYLEKDGMTVIRAVDGQDAWTKIQDNKVDLAVVDIMMPVMDGYQLIKKIRSRYAMPVIVLSAKGEDSDKILGLDLGADDYMAKPFNPLELVQAQLRRSQQLNPQTAQRSGPIVIGEISLDEESCTVLKRGEPIALTQTEYKILAFLMNNAEKVLTKKQIFESVWDAQYYSDDGTIMVHISNLRDKIEDESKQPVYLKTIRGLGYKFEKEPKLG